ncbi:ATP synthase, subunit C [Enterococcus faecalis 13-SD-W-01]|nr:ATP synthase, subunit C [Enterococcus faecalis 13-SD-W-01]
MKDIQFNAVNTRIRTYEGRLLSKQFYERMFAAKEAEEIYQILQETAYGDFIDETTKVHDFEEVLIAELKRTYDTLYEITPDRSIIDLFTVKYDYQNLKVLVKAAYTKKDLSDLLVPIGSLPLKILKELVNVRHSEEASEQMNACIEEVFQYIEDYHESQSIDIIFDNYYWEQQSAAAKKENRQEIQQLIQRNIDIFNISTALRSHLMGRKKGFISAVLADGGNLPAEEILSAITASLDEFVEYLRQTRYQNLINKSYEEITTKKTLNDFDLLKDNFLMARFKEQKIVPFGPAAVLGYINAKEMEIKNLRILLIGKINKIPEEILRKRVRDSYV